MTDTLFDVVATPTVVTGRLPTPTGSGLRLGPCTIKTANQIVSSWHRHSKPAEKKVIADWDTPSRRRDAEHHEEIDRVRWVRRLRADS